MRPRRFRISFFGQFGGQTARMSVIHIFRMFWRMVGNGHRHHIGASKPSVIPIVGRVFVVPSNASDGLKTMSAVQSGQKTVSSVETIQSTCALLNGLLHHRIPRVRTAVGEYANQLILVFDGKSRTPILRQIQVAIQIFFRFVHIHGGADLRVPLQSGQPAVEQLRGTFGVIKSEDGRIRTAVRYAA